MKQKTIKSHFFITSHFPKRASSIFLCCFLILGMTPMYVDASQLYTTDGVNVRSEPNSSSTICTVLEMGSSVKKTGQSGNWIAVTVDGVSGYIYKDYLSSSQKVSTGNSNDSSQDSVTGNQSSSNTTYVNSTEVNLRKKANSHCKVKAVLEKGEEVTILSHSGNWTKVQRSNGVSGYVYSIYLGSGKSSTSTGSDGQTSASRADVIAEYRADAISYAEGRLGDTYSQDYRDTEGYADCSSLVRDAFLNVTGVFIGNTTTTQVDTMSDYIYSIEKITDATPGDLLYHLSDDSHTGIYLGNGRVLHASQKSGTVKISVYDSSSTYWEYGCNAAAYCYDN